MKTVAIYSGGLDSTVLLHHLQAEGDEVLAVSVDYGQRHRKELDFARRTAAALNIPWQLADVRGISHLIGGSSLTSSDIAVPHGHYAEETMKATVVPNRNMIMLAVAGGWAIANKADRLAYGAHTGDHAIYPDCRPEFVRTMHEALLLADWHRVELVTPFVGWTKSQIVRRGAELGVDFASTWSCYEGGNIHCGACGTCFERREAFEQAGVKDPTEYASRPEYRAPG
jgi:7-cyano-7-deazaguanine synthase